MSLVKIGPGGQIILPEQLIDALGLSPGDDVALFQRADEIVMRPVKETLLDLRGGVSVGDRQDFRVIREQVKAEIGQRAVARDD